MKKSKSKKRTRKAILFIKAIIRLIDKKIITPITKFIMFLSDKMGKRTDKKNYKASFIVLLFLL